MTCSPPPPTCIRESAPSSADCRFLQDGVAVQSSLLASVAHDHDQAVLQLEFRGGAVYHYFHVPHQIYQDLLQADSQGAYFNRHIRSVFRCARLGAQYVAPRPGSAVPR
ncbi:MAG: KTSC domain-containing protein [Acidobacteriia bacterium]|nr:KTSC domain-containing protein [Terriglobia bacterium]